MSDTRATNALWARTLVEELVRAGVELVSLAPGSRSTPLVMAFAREPRVRIQPHIDERSAAFFALGGARASGRPAVVVTTSGTAAANLLPAVVEAAQSAVPLLVLTADRPPELRGADANQAIDQLRLFGHYPREFFEVGVPSARPEAIRHLRALACRAVARALGPPAGPVHLNLPFPKPLEPPAEGGEGEGEPANGGVAATAGDAGPSGAAARSGDAPYTRIAPPVAAADPAALAAIARALAESRRPLLVCGPVPDPERLGPAARALAAAAGAPLLADPLSGARYGAGALEGALGAYDLFLRGAGERGEEARGEGERGEAGRAGESRDLAPDLVLRLGASPTSAVLLGFLEAHAAARQVVVDAGGRWKDHLALASDYLQADPAAACQALAAALPAPAAEPSWRERWREAERAARTHIESALEGEFFEGTVLAEVVRRMPAGGALFVSNSMPIRDLDTFGAAREEELRVFANRGASGIDGIVSTAAGAAAAIQREREGGAAAVAGAGGGGGPALVAVLGDLAFCHDMNGLLAVGREGIEVLLVVINNDGGGIFDMLPIREFEPEFTRYFATPHGLDLARAAALYGLPYRRVSDAAGLAAALEEGLARAGPAIVEVVTERAANRRRHEEIARTSSISAE